MLKKTCIFLALFCAQALCAAAPKFLGFECAAPVSEGGRELKFPDDFGPHNNFRLEWWYYTGNLTTKDGQPLGFQLTLIRLGVLPNAKSQTYMAHLAVTAPSVGKGFFFGGKKVLSSKEMELNGDPFNVGFKDNTTLNFSLISGETGAVGSSYLLSGALKDEDSGLPLEVSLQVTDAKGVVLQGDKGLSKKGEGECNASYYFSQPQLLVDAGPLSFIKIGDERLEIKDGKVWMDHEFSTPRLDNTYANWEWFNVKLDNNSELMFFNLRDKRSGDLLMASGTLINPDASLVPLAQGDFAIEPKESWESPKTKISYATKWDVQIPKLNTSLEVQALIPNQELRFNLVKIWRFLKYWEGATFAKGYMGDVAVAGAGYVEQFGN